MSGESPSSSSPPVEPAESAASSSATFADVPSTKLPSTIDSSRAVEALKTRLVALTSLLQHNLTAVSISLLAKSIISAAEWQNAMSNTPIPMTRTVTLLNAVLDKITHEPPVFVDFVEILETEPSLTKQANELVLCYQGSPKKQLFKLEWPNNSYYSVSKGIIHQAFLHHKKRSLLSAQSMPRKN